MPSRRDTAILERADRLREHDRQTPRLTREAARYGAARRESNRRLLGLTTTTREA